MDQEKNRHSIPFIAKKDTDIYRATMDKYGEEAKENLLWVDSINDFLQIIKNS